MIRLATKQDIPAMVDIIWQSHEHMGFGAFFPEGMEPFDTETVSCLLLDILDSPQAGVFVAEQAGKVAGCCGVILSPFTWNAHILSATELFWHMRDDMYPTMTGKRLFIRMLDIMTAWARARGARFFVGITKPGPAGKLLERRGLNPMETTYGGAL